MRKLRLINGFSKDICMTIRAGYSKYSQQQVYQMGNFKNPFVMETTYTIAAVRGRSPTADGYTQQIEYNKSNTFNSLTHVQKDNYVVEYNSIMTTERSELAKRLRKQGIEHFRNRQMKVRKDNLCGALTSVLKDNYVMNLQTKQQHHKDFDYDYIDVTVEEGKQNDPKYVDEIMHYIVEDSKIDLRPLMQDGYIYICINGDMYRTGIRIRKLTERECFRLMDLDDDDIDKIQAFRYPQDQTTTDCLGRILLNEEGKEQKQRKNKPISRTAQYRLAANSIVVACLEGIFEQLFFPKESTNNVPKQLALL